MASAYNKPVTIQNVVDKMMMKTGVNDERVIRTHMYNFVKEKGNVTLNNYLNKPPTANSMLGTTRAYATFIMDPLRRSIEKNASSNNKSYNKYNNNFPPLSGGKRRKGKLTKKNRRKSKKSKKSRKSRKHRK